MSLGGGLAAQIVGSTYLFFSEPLLNLSWVLLNRIGPKDLWIFLDGWQDAFPRAFMAALYTHILA